MQGKKKHKKEAKAFQAKLSMQPNTAGKIFQDYVQISLRAQEFIQNTP